MPTLPPSLGQFLPPGPRPTIDEKRSADKGCARTLRVLFFVDFLIHQRLWSKDAPDSNQIIANLEGDRVTQGMIRRRPSSLDSSTYACFKNRSGNKIPPGSPPPTAPGPAQDHQVRLQCSSCVLIGGNGFPPGTERPALVVLLGRERERATPHGRRYPQLRT